MSRRTATASLILLTVVALGACDSGSGTAPGTASGAAAEAGGGSGATVAGAGSAEDVLVPEVIAVSAGGSVSVDGVDLAEIDRPVAGLTAGEPAPASTRIDFDGWSTVVTSAEVTTQPSESPTNPLAVVVQLTLEVTAPQDAASSEGGMAFPFRPTARVNGVDFRSCFAPDGEIELDAGEQRKVDFCLAARGSEEWRADTPTVSVALRYGGSRQVERIEVATTRGPDY
ncbi:MAG: hypothetical protein ACTMIR_15395 [Cellulomonadaceae bacterium]